MFIVKFQTKQWDDDTALIHKAEGEALACTHRKPKDVTGGWTGRAGIIFVVCKDADMVKRVIDNDNILDENVSFCKKCF